MIVISAIGCLWAMSNLLSSPHRDAHALENLAVLGLSFCCGVYFEVKLRGTYKKKLNGVPPS